MQHTSGRATSPARGSVSLDLTVPAPVERVFDALSEPALTREWFGVLSNPLREGGRATLDFEDGDFFALDSVHVDRPSRIAYGWRFLGLGPRDAIEWHIAPVSAGSRVTVTDTDPLRSPEWNDALREGWKDFTSRISRFLSTGENARYDWRRELDGGVELECPASSARRLLESPVLPKWLPSGGLVEQDVSWGLSDGLRPARVTIRSPKIGKDVRFEIYHPSWSAATKVSLSVRARDRCSILSFSHNGWEGLGGDGAYQKDQRRRFAALWIAALSRAREVVVAPVIAAR
jgi:uncharacterized protein YndB with AHSA1/START domain